MNIEDGIFLVNKPLKWSSYKVVGFLKKKFKLRKIGHAGTLDPLAIGLLIILVGRATKKFDAFQKLPKEYEAVIEFGRETDTYDREGDVVSEYKKDFKLKKTEVEKVLKKFKGRIKQIPPIFSAIKIKGERAYKLARQGKKPKISSREATIYNIELLKLYNRKARIYFKVSSGTYIRSLARDIGKSLGYGGYLFSLKRTGIGSFKLSKAKKPEKITLRDFKKYEDA